MWFLGYPETALADADRAIKDARVVLMVALGCAVWVHSLCGKYQTASSLIDELATLAEEKGAAFWKAGGILLRGWLFSMTGNTADAVEMITSGLTAQHATGATTFDPVRLSDLGRAYADLGRFDDAWRSIDEAMMRMDTTKEKWWEAETIRTSGEITLKSPEPDVAKAEAYFQRALAVARQQQAKSWELRAAMSLARLWRDQGKRDAARDLLAPVYNWFTEGFDTLDLKEAKALLEELAA
jgi:predicted ATPase